MARKANKILFLDTDTMTTQQWFKRYWGHEDKEIGSLQYERHHDAYILTTPDFPFVQDGFRNDPPEGREPLQVNLKEAIVRSRLPYLEVRGSKAARLHNAVRFIEDKLGVEYKDV
jgi:nicotinamide riboside kinase